ncbi:hypothetical protein AAG570_002210 [Ranatra chinensis]|uniref:Uncharacterized protein n=1 Tax=Ranatra chinensis TaxID=642074 RepID=A0ABD0Y7A0_9HEMI
MIKGLGNMLDLRTSKGSFRHPQRFPSTINRSEVDALFKAGLLGLEYILPTSSETSRRVTQGLTICAYLGTPPAFTPQGGQNIAGETILRFSVVMRGQMKKWWQSSARLPATINLPILRGSPSLHIRLCGQDPGDEVEELEAVAGNLMERILLTDQFPTSNSKLL